ncbi:MAG: flagellar hook assembly protein FlgD [Silicimonas sp.]|jgi:flagellar basal-body rod modification protein FlgD|nr:flagellar hook assembly protein FlgD [Silicimonas sp.]
MDINTQNVHPLSPGTAAASAESRPSQIISSDFETFLLMLTTQLENQDPLNPIESQDFAVQLATFSSVEQQVLTNDLIRELKGALGASDLAQLAGWVGMEARVTAPVQLRGQPVDIAVDVTPGSDRAELIVRNTYGLEVSREQVPTTSGTYSWAGTGSDGAPLPDGDYSLEIASIFQGEITGTRTVPHYVLVTEARQGTDGIELVTGGGLVVAADNVSGLRQPGSQSDQ